MGVFTMPSLGSDMEAGTLVEWMVGPGDSVKRGDVVAVVETQKGAIEIEVFEAGTVHDLTANLGEELPVGAPLAFILGEGEEAPAAPAKAAQAPAAPPEKADVQPSEPPRAPGSETAPPPAAAAITLTPPGGVMASPAARRRAHELGIDLDAIKGTGLGGAIQLSDVETASAPAEKAKPKAAEVPSPMAEMRKAIAAAMTRAKREIPHLYVGQTIAIDASTKWLSAHNENRPPTERLLLGALFVRAAVIAASKVKVVNGHYENDAFQPSDVVHAGVAVALRGGGLVAPAILDAQDKTLSETMASMRDLVSRARAGRLKASEMTMGTLTVSALGESGAETMTGVIFPPQVAVLCLGAPQTRPWIVDGALAPCQTIHAALSLDHRIGDGRQASAFLTAFDAALQTPEAL